MSSCTICTLDVHMKCSFQYIVIRDPHWAGLTGFTQSQDWMCIILFVCEIYWLHAHCVSPVCWVHCVFHTCMNTLIKQRLNWIQPRWIEVIIYNQTVCSGTMCLKFGPVGRRCLLCMTKNRPNMLHTKSTCKILKSNIHVHYTLIKYQPWFGPHWRNATCHPAIQPDSWFM